MMQDIGNYLISIVCASAICGILTSLVGSKGSATGIIRILTGIFLATTVIAPLTKLELKNMDTFWDQINIDVDSNIQAGTDMANAQRNLIIKEQLEAYILDKAETLGACINAEITISQDEIPQPLTVQISGSVSPYNKKILTEYISKELGISEDQQIWK